MVVVDGTGDFDSISYLGSIISNRFGILIKNISSIFSSFITVCSYIIDIFKALRYGLISLLSGVWSLIVQVFDGGVFTNVGRAFTTLSHYIGTPAVVFIATLLLIAIFRIGLAFVFKIFRLNLDYKPKNPGENKTYVIYNLKDKK